MSNDSFTKTTSKSWFSRLGNAFAAVLIGFGLFIGSFFVLGWNEGRAIHREKTLEAGASQVISVSAEGPAAENEGKLVHLSGDAAAGADVTDPEFAITASALKLQRNVEMYQWQESEKSDTKQKLGGGEETTTTYTYAKGWSSSLIDSTRFQKPDGHTNPRSMAVQGETFVADGIHVGKFQLPASLTDQLDDFADRRVTEEEASQTESLGGRKVSLDGNGLYLGEDAASPIVGDVRVGFATVPTGTVTIVARQVAGTFEPFSVGRIGTIELIKAGTFSADNMFREEQASNAMMTWILRLVGFVMMLIGLCMVTNVLSIAASVIPFLGNIVGAGTGLMAFAIALPLTLTTIAFAWLAYRPMIGIPLFVAAAACIYFAIAFLSKSRRKS